MASSTLTIEFDRYSSDFGDFFIARSPRGVCAIEFAVQSVARFKRGLGERYPGAQIVDLAQAPSSDLDAAAAAVFTDSIEAVPLDVAGTDFQRLVWQELMRIPKGETVSYEELAHRIGRPQAARAVASAVARNCLAYVIPCHRVVRKDGSTGGYRWGPRLKSALLEWEHTATQ